MTLRAERDDGTKVRAVSLAHHWAVVCTLASGLCGVIGILGMRLYDVQALPSAMADRVSAQVMASFDRTLNERQSRADETHKRLEGRIDENTRRIGKLEDWRDEQPGHGWRMQR